MASSLACTISTPKHTAAFLSIRLPAQPSHQPLAHRGDRVLARAASSEPQQSATASQQDIEGLRSTYCDDFECTSSPAVEATVRAFSRDLTRANGVYTRSLLFRDVVYKDAFRRFKGADGYQRMNFVPRYVKGATVTISKMRMEGTGAAVIDWRLRGTVGPFPVDVDMTSTISLNLLTGQIEKHEEAWSLRRCSPPAAAAWTTARAAWAASAGGAEVAKSTSSMLDSLTSMDEDEGFTQPNPNDPMKFFQQKDTFKEDAFTFVGFLLLLYVMGQAWASVFK